MVSSLRLQAKFGRNLAAASQPAGQSPEAMLHQSLPKSSGCCLTKQRTTKAASGHEMQVEQNGTVNKPIIIDQRFFEQLKPIISDLQRRRLRDIADRHKMTIEQIESIRDNAPEPRPEIALKADENFDLEKERKKTDDWYEATTISREISTEAFLTCAIAFDTGFKTETNDLNQITSIINAEPGCLKSLSFVVGQSFRGIGFRILLENTDPPGYYYITGQRDQVDHLYQSITRLLKSSVADHAWLHNQTNQFALSFLLAMASAATIIAFASRFSLEKSLAQTLGVMVLLTSLVGAIVLTIVLIKKLSKVFPRLEADFGPESRRQKSQRRSLYMLLTAILIPVVINIVFLNY